MILFGCESFLYDFLTVFNFKNPNRDRNEKEAENSLFGCHNGEKQDFFSQLFISASADETCFISRFYLLIF